MKLRLLWCVAACALLCDAARAGSPITLTLEQRRAIGIELAHPIPAKIAARIDSLGIVLDPTSLVADEAEFETAAALDRAAIAESRRLKTLGAQEAGVSAKMLDAAAAEQAKTDAQRRLAGARFAQRWSPLMHLPPAERRGLIDSVARGDELLLRADWPGRQSISTPPDHARIDVDGVSVAARVMGVLRSESATMSAAVLLIAPKAPAGLAPGAHVAVSLGLPKNAGFLIPDTAILFDENGAYVFKQLAATPGEDLRYKRVDVKLLAPSEHRWLVSGEVDDDDDVVVAGVGALWSLEGLHGRIVDDDDDAD